MGFATIPQISLDSLHQKMDSNTISLIDVREPHEYSSKHIPKSKNLPLTEIGISDRIQSESDSVAVICPSGFRSTTAASLLKRAGTKDIVLPIDGINGWEAKGFPLEA